MSSYGDCTSIGGTRYALIIIDRATRFTWALSLKTLNHENIIKAFIEFKLLVGGLPKRLYTDFDHRELSGQTRDFLNRQDCSVFGAPASRQHQNGLVERQWQSIMNMARSYLTQYKMPRTFWWWAIRHVTQVSNMLPCKIQDSVTSPIELVFGVKPDFSILVPLFATTYFKHRSDGQRLRDGIESKVMQAILLGRSDKSDGYLLYSPHTKEFCVSSDCKIDTGKYTATCFNLSCDGGLFIGLYDSGPIANGWIASYLIEIQGIIRMKTFKVISAAEYMSFFKKTKKRAIPNMCVLTIKFDGEGLPARAKSRIVVLGNLDQTQYTKGEKYAPVATHYAVRLIICLAIASNRPLKQCDCKNTFVQSDLLETIIVRPPPNCPYSKPNTFWLLHKSLHGLKSAPRYWWNKIKAIFVNLKMKSCPHEPCYFIGHPLDNEPVLHLVLYVDDFIYFSSSDKVETHFEELLRSEIVVDFMGVVDSFLGIKFNWCFSDKSNIKCKLTHDSYIDNLLLTMKLENSKGAITSYRSGYPIDAIQPETNSDQEQASITSTYRTLVGRLTWLAISTRPDISTAVSFLASYQAKPTKSHIEPARHVGRHLKSTISKGINFLHKNASKLLEAYTHIPIDDFEPTSFADANWEPQDAYIPSEINQRLVSLTETKSVVGFIVFYHGSPIMWKAFKEARCSRSSCEAEIKATDECTKASQFFLHVLQDLNIPMLVPVKIYNDNRGCVDWSASMSVKRLRHYNIRENCVREAVIEKEILAFHIPGPKNPGDIMTKEHKSDTIYCDLRDLVVF